MAIGISSANPGMRALDAMRQEPLRRRERNETPGSRADEREPAPEPAPVEQAQPSREAREPRLTVVEPLQAPPRTVAAYLGVQRATPADPGAGELVGIDIYV